MLIKHYNVNKRLMKCYGAKAQQIQLNLETEDSTIIADQYIVFDLSRFSHSGCCNIN